MGYGDVIVKRNKKCNIAGILFGLIFLVELCKYVIFVKTVFETNEKSAWLTLYSHNYEDGFVWIMLMASPIVMALLIGMFNASFRLQKVSTGKRKKTTIVYFIAMFLIWSITYNENAAKFFLSSPNLKMFLYRFWNYDMIYACMIVYLIAYYLYRSGNKTQEGNVSDPQNEKIKIGYYKNLMEHNIITQKEYQSMVEKIKLGQLM